MLVTLMCLSTAVYFEARGEPLEGQFAVAEVVLNRTEDDRFPASACSVIYEERRPGKCQFSFACGPMDIDDHEAFLRSAAVAAVALTGKTSYANGALYFHVDGLSMTWTDKMDVTARIGDHVFLAD